MSLRRLWAARGARSDVRTMLCLCGVLGMAALLRVKGLNDESYWLDELYSAEFSNPRLSFMQVADLPVRDIHPPLYQLLLWACFKALGYTELTGRLLSAVLGVACVFVLYLLGRDLFERRVGVAAAAIAAVNIALIQYSQEARSYELFAVLAGLSWWRLYWMLERRSGRDLLIYAFVTVLLIYTHYYSVVVVAAQMPAFIWRWWNTPAARQGLFKLAAASAAVFAAAAAPLIPYALALREWGDYVSLPKPPMTAIADNVLAHFSSVPVLLLAVPALVAVDGMLSRRTPARDRNALLMLALWAVLGYSLPWVKSVLSTPAMNSRYVLPQVLPVILLCAYGGVSLWSRYRVAMILGALIFVGASLQLLRYSYYWPATKDDFRNVLLDIAEGNSPSIPVYERVPFNGYDQRSNQFQAYADMLGLDLEVLGDGTLQEHFETSTLPECFWLVDAHFYPELNRPFAESVWSQGRGYVAVEINKYRGAESVLMARETVAEKCVAHALQSTQAGRAPGG